MKFSESDVEVAYLHNMTEELLSGKDHSNVTSTTAVKAGQKYPIQVMVNLKDHRRLRRQTRSTRHVSTRNRKLTELPGNYKEIFYLWSIGMLIVILLSTVIPVLKTTCLKRPPAF